MTAELSRPEVKEAERDRSLVVALRVFGMIDMLAFIAVLMPRAWIVFTHETAGLGEFPDVPVASYLARSASALYGFYGVVLWYIATDVRHYWRLITFFARLAIVLGGVLLTIDLIEQMPLWWTLVEGPMFATAGFVTLRVQRYCDGS